MKVNVRCYCGVQFECGIDREYLEKYSITEMCREMKCSCGNKFNVRINKRGDSYVPEIFLPELEKQSVMGQTYCKEKQTFTNNEQGVISFLESLINQIKDKRLKLSSSENVEAMYPMTNTHIKLLDIYLNEVEIDIKYNYIR